MTLVEWFEVRDFQNLGGQNILNVYHVRNLGAGGPAANVAQSFIDSVLPALTPIQSNTLARTVIEVQNLGSPFDFATVDSSAHPGTRAGAALPTSIAATIQMNRTRTDIKNGMKRFTVGIEADLTTNFWDAPFIVLLQVLGDAIVTPWFLAGTPTIDRVEFGVLKRFCTTTPSPPCSGGYRLPDTDAEIAANFYIPTSATVRDTVRSQVSRKRLV